MAPLSPKLETLGRRTRIAVVSHAPRALGYRGAVSFELEGFVRSLASDASATRQAYRGDVEAFAAWANRAGVSDPAKVDRLMLRRYLAYLATRRYSRRTIARKAAALRRYFAWLRRRELIRERPVPAPLRALGRSAPAHVCSRRRSSRSSSNRRPTAYGPRALLHSCSRRRPFGASLRQRTAGGRAVWARARRRRPARQISHGLGEGR